MSSLDSSSEIEESVDDRRLTRVLDNKDVEYIENSISSDFEENDSCVEETENRPPALSPEGAKDMIGQVEGMTTEQVQELLHKLHLMDEEGDEEHINAQKNVFKEEEEPNSQHNEQQKKKTQRTQTKKPVKGNTKGSKHYEDDESNLENKISKPKEDIKNKKYNSKGTNKNAHLEENPSKLEIKKKGDDSESINKNEILNKKPRNDCSSEVLEKKTSKSKNDKVEINNKKEKQNKTSKKAGNDNQTKELETNTVDTEEIHVAGRSMRSRKAKEVLKEINEPVNNLDSETGIVQNKRNGKKHELEIKNPEVNTNTTAGKKKRAGKKQVPEEQTIEKSPVSIISHDENAVIKVNKAVKKVPSEIKELQDKTVSASIKDDGKTNLRQKNTKKGISEPVKNMIEEDLTSNMKNTKAKKKPTNAKATEIVDDSQIGKVNTEKTTLKSTLDLEKNKKLTENKENKINEETVPKKRATRKK